MKRKTTLCREWLLLLLFDVLTIMCNPLLPKHKRENWMYLRTRSKSWYKIYKILIK